jgi:hypothetical protein
MNSALFDHSVTFAIALAVADAPGRIIYLWRSPGEAVVNADLIDLKAGVVQEECGVPIISPGAPDLLGAVRIGALHVALSHNHAVTLGAWFLLLGHGAESRCAGLPARGGGA